MGLKALFGKDKRKERREVVEIDLEKMSEYMEEHFGLKQAVAEEMPEEKPEQEEVIEFQTREEK